MACYVMETTDSEKALRTLMEQMSVSARLGWASLVKHVFLMAAENSVSVCWKEPVTLGTSVLYASAFNCQ